MKDRDGNKLPKTFSEACCELKRACRKLGHAIDDILPQHGGRVHWFLLGILTGFIVAAISGYVPLTKP